MRETPNLGTMRTVRKKSFFDIAKPKKEATFFDLDVATSRSFKKKPEQPMHLDIAVSFTPEQLNDHLSLERLDALIPKKVISNTKPLIESINLSILGTRPNSYKDVVLESYSVLIERVKRLYTDILKQKETTAQPAFEIIDTIIKVFVSDRNIMLNLCNLETKDDHLYQHVVKMAIYSVNIAIAMGCSKEEIREIGVGALMSDIGMAAIAKRIRNFKGTYTKEELYYVRKHPIFSANIIESLEGFPVTTAIIAYQTHERSNGKGYPRNKRENTIHRFSKIVALADVYTALSSKRPHRQAYRPFEAVRMIISMADKGWFSKEVVQGLLSFSSLFPVGSIVKLNTNAYGKVVSASGKSIAAPVVVIFTDKEGYRLVPKQFTTTDLSVNSSIKIIGTKDNQFLATAAMVGF
ncbi:MAG: HD domain-containing protein [Fibrobacterales bacterium]